MRIRKILKYIGIGLGVYFTAVIVLMSIFGNKPKVPISTLEARAAIEKDVEDKYPDAVLMEVFAGSKATGGYCEEIPSGRIVPCPGSKVEKISVFQNDGKADGWLFSFYSPSEKLEIEIKVYQLEGSEISSSTHTGKKKTAPLRADLSFDLQSWKIDSTEAAEILKSKFGSECQLWHIKLTKSYTSRHKWELVWEINYSVLSSTEEVKEARATIDAISGEIL